MGPGVELRASRVTARKGCGVVRKVEALELRGLLGAERGRSPAGMHTLPIVGLGLQNLVFSVPPLLSSPVCPPWCQELGEKRVWFRCLMLEE